MAQVLDALQACPEFRDSPVFIFSDGPKNDAALLGVAAVRAMIRARLQPNMELIEAPRNRGLAASIIAGVTRLCEEYGRVIVIEDDLLLSPCTLSWFNKGLIQFAEEQNVWQISAHQFPVPQFKLRQDGMMVRISTSWGWATWKRAWDRFDPDGTGWEALTADSAMRRRFDLDDSYPYYELMQRQMRGQADSWAIRWWWSMFRADALGLFPPRSLVSNIGLDETATHSAYGRLKGWLVPMPGVSHETDCPVLPANALDTDAEAAIKRAIRRMWWPTRLRARLRALSGTVSGA